MKILAIDIGTANVKSVIVEAKFKRFDVVLHDVTSVGDAWDPPAQSDSLLTPGQISTLAEIRRRYASGVDRIVANVPFSLYSSRFMSFPFRDKRKIQNAVKFAVEDEIPFDLDHCVLTSHIYPSKGKETHVLTGFAPLEALENFLSSIESIQLPIDCLMMEDSALSSMFLRMKGERPKNVAVLNLGHRKSSVFFFRDGHPVLHRTTMVGGFHVTAAIAKQYGISMAEAELAKIDRAFLAVPGMQMTSDQEVFSETIRQALEPVFMDFQQSLMAFTSRYNETLDLVYLSGGTSLLPGLPEYVTHRWQKRALPLAVTQLFPNFTIQPQRNLEWMLPMAAALGLSQVSGDGKSQINFRTGKLQATGAGLQLNFRQFLYPAKLVGAVYVVAMLSLIGQSFLLKHEAERKDELLGKSLRSVLGQVSSSALTLMKSSPTRLRQNVNAKVQEFQAQVQGGPKTDISLLNVIQDFSKAVPPPASVEIKQMNLNGNQLSVIADAPSQADAEKALSAFTKLPAFQSAKAGPIESGEGNRKKFSFTATLKKGG